MSTKSFNAVVLSALSACMLVPTIAHAAEITSTKEFNISKTSTPALSGTGSKTATKSANTVFNQFDASKGVLTGVSISAETKKGSQNNSVSVTYDKNTSSGTTTSTVKSTVGLSAVGASNNAVSTGQATATCTTSNSWGVKSANCGNGPAYTTIDTTARVSSSGSVASSVSTSVEANKLNDYVGNKTVTVKETLTVESSNEGAINKATVSTSADAAWMGETTLSYIYQDHAKAVLEGATDGTLNLDFGSFYLGDTVDSLGFSLFNLFGDRVALSLIGFTETGDANDQFGTNLFTFDGLSAGSSKLFEADFAGNAVGKYSASYQLTFADYAPGAASKTLHSGSTLTLNLFGEVMAKPNEVPEPASLMLLGLGAVAFGVSRKRRQG